MFGMTGAFYSMRLQTPESATVAEKFLDRESLSPNDEHRVVEPGADHPAIALAVRDEIMQAVGQLPVEQREAFLLKHVEDLSYEEMQALTGLSESALKMRVKRACERLRELLEKVPQ